MGKVVFTWELGGGMGHIVRYIPFLASQLENGHEAILLLKDLTHVNSLLADSTATCLPAPKRTKPITKPIRVPCTYTHILHNNGYSDFEALADMVTRWRELFDTIRPDTVIFDHSPTALLAARGYDFRKIHLGTGFFIPPDVYPLPNLRTWIEIKPGRLRREEDYLLGVMNRVLARFKASPLKRIAELFSQDPHVLMTYKELDPYGERPGETYWGTWMPPIGEAPVWPDKPGKRIFAYLKPFPPLPSLLSLLNTINTPTLVYIDRLDPKLKEKHASPALRFVDKPLNMDRVAGECDLGILNGTLNSTANLLMAGKPTLHFPLYLEQHLTAQKVEQLGAGLSDPSLQPKEMETKLNLLLNFDSYSEKARSSFSRYQGPSLMEQKQRLNAFVDAIFM
jgi:spore coat polysaccharide biosynthesis predicted glycosyltransferase SpsG